MEAPGTLRPLPSNPPPTSSRTHASLVWLRVSRAARKESGARVRQGKRTYFGPRRLSRQRHSRFSPFQEEPIASSVRVVALHASPPIERHMVVAFRQVLPVVAIQACCRGIEEKLIWKGCGMKVMTGRAVFHGHRSVNETRLRSELRVTRETQPLAQSAD